MDWRDVAKAVAPLAPTLGGFLGGFIPFPGGGLAGQMLGNVIAKQFGVEPTPDAVGKAIAASPNEVALARLNAAMEEARAQWPAIAEMEKAWAKAQETAAIQVNETMRAEIGREHWFFNGWRPAAGWLFNIFAVICIVLLTIAALRAGGGDHALINAIKEIQTMAGALLGSLAAIVGVYVIGRSQEKSKAIEVAPAPPPVKPFRK